MTDYTKLIVVYDADGTFVGEITYIAGSLLGIRHCSACDITHSLSQIGQGTGGEKPAWTALKKTLPIPVIQLHRNDLDAAKWGSLIEQVPLIVGERKDGSLELVCSNAELQNCQGSVEQLEVLIEQALETKLEAVACPMRKRTTPKATAKRRRRSTTPAKKEQEQQGRTTTPHTLPTTQTVAALEHVLVVSLWLFCFVALVFEPLYYYGCNWHDRNASCDQSSNNSLVRATAKIWRIYTHWDPVFAECPLWLRVMCTVEVFVFGPLYGVCAYGLQHRIPWILQNVINSFSGALLYSTIVYVRKQWGFVCGYFVDKVQRVGMRGEWRGKCTYFSLFFFFLCFFIAAFGPAAVCNGICSS